MNPAPHQSGDCGNMLNSSVTRDLILKPSDVYKERGWRWMLIMEFIYIEIHKSKKDNFEREKRIKYYTHTFRNLKLRLKETFLKGGAG